jgi:hypothetical protein
MTLNKDVGGDNPKEDVIFLVAAPAELWPAAGPTEPTLAQVGMIFHPYLLLRGMILCRVLKTSPQ